MTLITGLKRRIGFKHPIMGVHVRHGDSCHTTSRAGYCKGLQAYIPTLRLLAKRYNTSRVFLATDSQDIVSQSKKYAKEFEFVHISYNRGALKSSNQIEYRKNLWDGSSNAGHDIMMSTLKDLMLLMDSDVLVTHQLSNLSRLALELSAAKKGRGVTSHYECRVFI